MLVEVLVGSLTWVDFEEMESLSFEGRWLGQELQVSQADRMVVEMRNPLPLWAWA